MRAAVVGHVEWMEFVPVEAVPRPGEIVHADESWEQAAGGGSVAAVQLAQLADSVDFFTVLGNDEPAQLARAELEARGVTVHATSVESPQRSGFTLIDDTGGSHHRGQVRAELDVNPDLWFFKCHFAGDPVMPGCLGLDALWQMTGFFLGWGGSPGKGRALGGGEIKFTGQVTNDIKLIEYGIDIRRVVRSKVALGISEGYVKADGKIIYECKDLRVGLFPATEAA